MLTKSSPPHSPKSFTIMTSLSASIARLLAGITLSSHRHDPRYPVSIAIGKVISAMSAHVCVPELPPDVPTNGIELRVTMATFVEELDEVTHFGGLGRKVRNYGLNRKAKQATGTRLDRKTDGEGGATIGECLYFICFTDFAGTILNDRESQSYVRISAIVCMYS